MMDSFLVRPGRPELDACGERGKQTEIFFCGRAGNGRAAKSVRGSRNPDERGCQNPYDNKRMEK